MTTNQARDSLLESVQLTTEAVRSIKNLAKAGNDARKLDEETYHECPRCKQHHSIRGNFDDLCDSCQQTILEHFPNHESVPHIQAALSRWNKR